MNWAPDVESAVRQVREQGPGVTLTDGQRESFSVVPVSVTGLSADLFISTDKTNRAVGFVRVAQSRARAFRISQVVAVSAEKMRLSSETADSHFLRLVCEVPALDVAFRRFLEDVRVRIDDGTSPDDSVPEAARDWRRLLELAKQGKSVQQLAGLYGELKMLQMLAAEHGADAASWWKGSDGERQDFRSHSSRIEVKTTTQPGNDRVTIHGLGQLDPAGHARCHLALLEVEIAPEGETVDDLVDQLERTGIPVPVLDGALEASGYVVGNSEHSEHLFTVRRLRWWPIEADGPGLRASQLASRMLQGVTGVQYELALGALGDPLDEDESAQVITRFGEGDA